MSENNFTRLASISVKDKIEKKNGLSYLSWAWAVDQLMRNDPSATWAYCEPQRWGDTVMVFCTVTAFGKPMTAQLPVMDHRNKAISNPDAFQVNTAMQRCLVKAIALHGLGLYIYAGEDLPADDPRAVNHSPVKEALKGHDISAERQSEIENMALIAIDQFRRGDMKGPLEIAHELEDTYEKLYFWDLLKTESKLRAHIKANPLVLA